MTEAPPEPPAAAYMLHPASSPQSYAVAARAAAAASTVCHGCTNTVHARVHQPDLFPVSSWTRSKMRPKCFNDLGEE